VNHRLIDTLDSIGKPTLPWHGPDGSAVLLLPHGGRVLGLFAAGSQENFYWTHPALESAASAAEFYEGRQWHNSGGDRTWLAPEVDFFFPRYPKTNVYHQPRELDPGNDPEDLGYAVQACNVDSGLGSFSELEYHVPAIGPGTGRMACEDVSQVWAFRGGRTTIDGIVSALLAPDLEPHAEKPPPQ
jgi:hypothetical protein